MKFERGKNPKSSMRIGLIERLEEIGQKVINKYFWDIGGEKFKSSIEKDISEELGHPVTVEIYQDDESQWHIEVSLSPEIQHKTVIDKGLHNRLYRNSG
jgi:hypothetical protein